MLNICLVIRIDLYRSVNQDGRLSVLFTLQRGEGEESFPSDLTTSLTETIVETIPGVQVLAIRRFGKKCQLS